MSYFNTKRVFILLFALWIENKFFSEVPASQEMITSYNDKQKATP